MNTKKQFFMISGIIIVIFMTMAYLLLIRPQAIEQTMSEGSSELQNDEGQEFDKAIGESAGEAEIRRQEIFKAIKENTIEREAIVNEIGASISDIDEKLIGLELESDNYLNLYYHSTFLMGLFENHDGKRTALKNKIEEHEITNWAVSVHDYLIECENATKLNETRAKELIEESSFFESNSISELVDMIIQTNVTS